MPFGTLVLAISMWNPYTCNYSSSPPACTVGRILIPPSMIYRLLFSSSQFVLSHLGNIDCLPCRWDAPPRFLCAHFLLGGDSASPAQCYLLNLPVNFSFLAWLPNSVGSAQYESTQDNDRESFCNRRL